MCDNSVQSFESCWFHMLPATSFYLTASAPRPSRATSVMDTLRFAICFACSVFPHSILSSSRIASPYTTRSSVRMSRSSHFPGLSQPQNYFCKVLNVISALLDCQASAICKSLLSPATICQLPGYLGLLLPYTCEDNGVL